MRIALFVGLPALASLGLASMLSAVAVAQDAGHACVQQGHRPGSAGFYRCLQEAGGSEASAGGEQQSGAPGEAESILSGSPENAVTDYTGSTMSGATSPDPDILKQLNLPSQAPR